ncbi:MAG: hypothetical protein QM704_09040 [Anaeromyxobacteraceae bacterium]
MIDRHSKTSLLLAALSLVALGGCNLMTAPAYKEPAAQNVEVAVTPDAATVNVNETVPFTATVTGAADTTVTWSATCGSVTATGAFTAPGTAGSCVVTAKSNAQPTATGSAVVTVSATPVPVAITIDKPTASAVACKTVQFTATVTGATNKAVTWSVQEGATGGTVSAAGLYTAPDGAGTYHVIATAAADTTKKVTATVTVTTQNRVGGGEPGHRRGRARRDDPAHRDRHDELRDVHRVPHAARRRHRGLKYRGRSSLDSGPLRGPTLGMSGPFRGAQRWSSGWRHTLGCSTHSTSAPSGA